MQNNINWGIIGLGNVALEFADAFKCSNNSKLKGISSHNSDKIKLFQEKFNIKKNCCFDNYEDLLKCKDIDIIYIALPNSMHQEWIIKCIKSKKKVLVEKPAFMNLRELDYTRKEVVNNKVFFSEGFMYRYSPQIIKVIDLIKNNSIGTPKMMMSNFGVNILTKKNIFGFTKRKKINKQNRLYNKDLGGGAVLDLGCYTVSLSILIASIVSEIKYDKTQILNKNIEIGSSGVDIEAKAKLVFDNGFESLVHTSFLKDVGTETIINGTDGIIKIKDPWRSEPAIITLEGKIKKEIEVETNKNIFSYEINAISKSILEGRLSPNFPGVDIDESIGLIKILHKWLN